MAWHARPHNQRLQQFYDASRNFHWILSQGFGECRVLLRQGVVMPIGVPMRRESPWWWPHPDAVSVRFDGQSFSQVGTLSVGLFGFPIEAMYWSECLDCLPRNAAFPASRGKWSFGAKPVELPVLIAPIGFALDWLVWSLAAAAAYWFPRRIIVQLKRCRGQAEACECCGYDLRGLRSEGSGLVCPECGCTTVRI
jgi:hypothetical protein